MPVSATVAPVVRSSRTALLATAGAGMFGTAVVTSVRTLRAGNTPPDETPELGTTPDPPTAFPTTGI